MPSATGYHTPGAIDPTCVCRACRRYFPRLPATGSDTCHRCLHLGTSFSNEVKPQCNGCGLQSDHVDRNTLRCGLCDTFEPRLDMQQASRQLRYPSPPIALSPGLRSGSYIPPPAPYLDFGPPFTQRPMESLRSPGYSNNSPLMPPFTRIEDSLHDSQNAHNILLAASEKVEGASHSRLSQSVKYSSPFQMNTSLLEARNSKKKAMQPACAGPIRTQSSASSAFAFRKRGPKARSTSAASAPVAGLSLLPLAGSVSIMLTAGTYPAGSLNVGISPLKRLPDIFEIFPLVASTIDSLHKLINSMSDAYYKEYTSKDPQYGIFPTSMSQLKFQIPIPPRKFPEVRSEWMNGSLSEFIQCLQGKNLYRPNKKSKFLILRVVFQQPEAAPPVEMDDDDDGSNTDPEIFGDAQTGANDDQQADDLSDLFLGNSEQPAEPNGFKSAPERVFDSSSAAVTPPATTATALPTNFALSNTTGPKPTPATGAITSTPVDSPGLYRPAFRPHGNRIGRQHLLLKCRITSITVGVITGGGDIRYPRDDFLEDKPECYIAQNWQGDRDHHYIPSCDSSYLGQGSLKFAVFGTLDGEDKAFFQCNPTVGDEVITEEANRDYLIKELGNNVMATYMWNHFHRRAASRAVGLPPISWNTKDAKILTLTPESAHHAGFQFRTFLVLPLLDVAEDEERFCSNLGVCEGITETEQILNAFQHHCFEESGRRIVFADFQGLVKPDRQTVMFDPLYHTPTKGLAGAFDIGQRALDYFKELHECKMWCIRLGLTDLAKSPPSAPRPRAKPRRITRTPTPGPDSPSNSSNNSLEKADVEYERALEDAGETDII